MQQIYHIYPVDDLAVHDLSSAHVGSKIFVDEDIREEVTCLCECDPIIKYLVNDHINIVHRSFDGREGVEWANEILNNL